MSDEGSGLVSKTTLAAGLGIAVLLGLAMLVVLVVGALAVGVAFFPGGEDVPPAQFDFEPQGEEVVVTMTEGDPLSGVAVWVEIGPDTPGTWADYAGDERIEPGDSITITRADPGDTVRLLWTPPDGSGPRELASYRVP